MWIGGQEHRPSGREQIAVVNPATEAEVARVVAGTARDAEDAARAAADAFPAWARETGAARSRVLRDVERVIREHRADLADLLVAEQGKPRPDNLGEVDETADTFAYFAGLAETDRGSVNPSDPGFLDFVIREPVGPVAAIVPWNFPLMLMARKVAPALAAGNTVVIKPSEETPLATLELARLLDGVVPPGVVNVVTGYGADVAEPLVLDPRIRHVAFTGSTATGARIAELAAPRMKRLTLELGGKDALIVGPDVDLAAVVPGVAVAGLYNAGQCCTSTERVFVAREVYEPFLDALVEHVGSYRVGDGTLDGTTMGPLIREQARDKVSAHVDQAVASGAKVLHGGARPTEPGVGWFYEPTVIVDVPADAALVREETFGPVLPVASFGSLEEAIGRVNDSDYGLGACVLSNDPAFVKRCIDDLDVGNVYVNDPLTTKPVRPFGGTKMSGIGRELGVEGLEAYRESKHVHWLLDVARSA